MTTVRSPASVHAGPDIDLAIGRVSDELRSYAAAHGGRFKVLPAPAVRRPRDPSDVDIMVDFPDAAEDDACTFPEEVCERHGLVCDQRTIKTTREPFLDRYRSSWTVLC